MTIKTLSTPTSVLGQRAYKCYKAFIDGARWDEVVASDSLMLYSKDFRNFVAEKCDVDPASGKRLHPTFTPDELAELRKADAKIDAKDGEVASVPDIELDEAEEEANGVDAEQEPDDADEKTGAEAEAEVESETDVDEESDDVPDDDSGDEPEDESEDEPEDELDVDGEAEEEELPAVSVDDCHWCGSAPATICLTVQAQESDGESRLVRLDHLCDDCAKAYWTALRNSQKERML